jgi:hypothetical protein
MTHSPIDDCGRPPGTEILGIGGTAITSGKASQAFGENKTNFLRAAGEKHAKFSLIAAFVEHTIFASALKR